MENAVCVRCYKLGNLDSSQVCELCLKEEEIQDLRDEINELKDEIIELEGKIKKLKGEK